MRSDGPRVGAVTALAAAAVVVTLVTANTGSAASILRCRTQQLRVAATDYGEAGGQFLQTFTFTNRTRHACSLAGWPRLDVPTRRVVQGAPNAAPFRAVILRPRRAASFDVYGADWNFVANKPCRKTRRVSITPPGARSALSVAVRIPHCGMLYIAPVIAGTKDRQSWSVTWNGP